LDVLVLTVFAAAGMFATQDLDAQPAPQKPVTFTKDVAPILQRSCQTCHRPGSIAPMSLLTYEDARPWARSVKQKVSQRLMPPWMIDRNVGIRKFKDDPSLTDEEIATIVAWVDAGAPQGRPADMPPPRHFEDADQWHIGKPDLLVPMPVEYTVKPAAADWWGIFTADTGLTEDRYLKAVETKPSLRGNRVVHHAVTNLVFPEGGGGSLNEFAVGKNGDIYPDGAGKLIKAGSKIRFNMHYHAIGEEITDRTTVGLVFYPKGYVPQHVITTVLAPTNEDLDFPAGADNVRTDAYMKLERPVRLTGYQPHMHNRGKAQCLEAIYPNMKVETLSCIDRYDFAWQIAYNYADDVTPLLPAGTILHTISWHDNSTANRNNPDPKNWVGHGNRSTDDMAKSWLNFYNLSEEEFKAEVAARAAKKTTSTNQQQ
jgi:hypothetical protein